MGREKIIVSAPVEKVLMQRTRMRQFVAKVSLEETLVSKSPNSKLMFLLRWENGEYSVSFHCENFHQIHYVPTLLHDGMTRSLMATNISFY